MRKEQLSQIMTEEVELFINNIAIELENRHDKWFDDFGFPIFGETSRDYHEQVYFQSYLESYTRDMINNILKKIFDDEVVEKIKWPELEFKRNNIYTGYTNKESEEKFGFEFINEDRKIGYCYTLIDPCTIDSKLQEFDVKKIVSISWEEQGACSVGYGDERVSCICIKELFQQIFEDEDNKVIDERVELFIKKMRDAVNRAQEMISLVTVPGFTPLYLFKNKPLILEDLVSEMQSLEKFNVKDVNYKQTEKESKKLIDEYRLVEFFLENKLEEAFIGSSKFAKSFLTAEYLFRYFEKNPMFDYTPIVSGYIKSIEQILHTICISYCSSKKMEKDMTKYTMGNYIDFLKNHSDIWREEVQEASNIIVKCLESYKIQDRNRLFHKDYFDDWKRVKAIRENTIFLYTVLLGATNKTVLKSNKETLSLIDYRYNELFSVLNNSTSNMYSMEIDGEEYSGLVKKQRSKGLEFYKHGVIKNEIVFENIDSNQRIKVSKNKMPEAIWETDICGKKTKKIW